VLAVILSLDCLHLLGVAPLTRNASQIFVKIYGQERKVWAAQGYQEATEVNILKQHSTGWAHSCPQL